MWNVFLVTYNICSKIHTAHTKIGAIEWCKSGDGADYVVFSERSDSFYVGSVGELFSGGQPGFRVVSNVVDGFNNLVCRGRSQPSDVTIKSIHQSRLHLDVEKLAEMFKLPVQSLGDSYVR